MRSVSVTERRETSRAARVAVMGVCLLVLVFSAGAYISHYRAERPQEAAAQPRSQEADRAKPAPQRAASHETDGTRKAQ